MQNKPIKISPKDGPFTAMEGHGSSYFSKLAEQKPYTVYGNYPVTALKEFNIDFDGCNFLVIYGTHINGGFCSIPNWQFGCELSTPDDTFYNAEQLERRFAPEIAKAIAYGIRDACNGVAGQYSWEENEDEVVVCGRCRVPHTVTESGAHLLSPFCPHCGTDLRTSRHLGSFPPLNYMKLNWE